MRKKTNKRDFICYFILTILVLLWLFPLFMALINSFKTNGELLTNVMSFPSSFHFENYSRTIEKMNYLRSFWNTVLLAGLGVFMMILFSALAGWRLCRTKTALSSAIFSLFVFSMLIPFSSIMIPLYKVVLALKIKNSLPGLAFVYAGMGVRMAVFLYHGFVKGIPGNLKRQQP